MMLLWVQRYEIYMNVCTCALLFSGDDDGGTSSLAVLLQGHIQTKKVLCILYGGNKYQLNTKSLAKSRSAD